MNWCFWRNSSEWTRVTELEFQVRHQRENLDDLRKFALQIHDESKGNPIPSQFREFKDLFANLQNQIRELRTQVSYGPQIDHEKRLVELERRVGVLQNELAGNRGKRKK